MRGSSSSSTSLKPLACKTQGTSPVGRKASRPSGRNVTSFWQQWQSVVISGNQWPSVAISGNQWQSVVISGNQWSSVAISGHPWHSVALSGPHLGSERVQMEEQGAVSVEGMRGRVPTRGERGLQACLCAKWRRGEHLHAKARVRARGRRTRPAGMSMCDDGAVVSTRLVLDGARHRACEGARRSA
jgi:hypothetical protein